MIDSLAPARPTIDDTMPALSMPWFHTVLLALVVTVVMFAGWTLKDWAGLRLLRLPDNDDMMRLAEVRDWIGGQAFNDLTQHRLGLPGIDASMHWSRIGDAGPAALLLLFVPLFGPWGGTLAMLIVYQALLFLAYLLLAARNARLLLDGRGGMIAVVFAALAFPTASLFVPGRIDHHALQIVLTMIGVGTLVAPRTVASGAIGGVAAALSLAVGLEVAPELAVLLAIMGVQWLIGGAEEDRRAAGFAIALGGVTLALLAFVRPQVWPGEWCDGFTPASTSATLAVAAGWGALALGGRRWTALAARLLIAVLVGGMVAVVVLTKASVCFAGPYGALDPYLQRVWMSNVSEARGMFYSEFWRMTALAYGGLCFAALVAVALVLRDPARRPQWRPVAVFLVLCFVAAVAQVRVTYVLAGIATLPFVALMVEARRHGAAWPRLLLWITGSGIVWNLAATPFMPSAEARGLARAGRPVTDCLKGPELPALARMSVGTVMTPLDSGAYVIGMTPHRAIAAPYHRNNPGNLAAYRFFLSPPDIARSIGVAHRVRYVAICPNSLAQAEVDSERRGSLIDLLQAGRTPAWLTPVAGGVGGMTVYRMN